ncbi:20092_t:CDS:2 [Gigaspora margarita]|uniref:20092_t:CDS:1 n=1 Tax=Gigaspora margarita TaxID=4874 RepID=A0ABN7UPJ7_GIGMA|nr:20092_t:CDS:2 [Gigaspora margarita]
MPRQIRKQLRNYFVIGFVLFRGNIQDFIKLFFAKIKNLEQGFVLHLNGIDYWITGRLGVFTADLPQGNNISGILRHNAYQGCRTYKLTKDQLTSLSFDIYYHDQEFQLINRQTSKNAKSRLCSQFGLRFLPGPLDSILHNHHLHIPQEAYHAIAEKNLPNLHISCHLVDYARQYATCVNSAIGTKEMVHRIFKAIVPHTNKHNLELVLLQQINTLQTLRHLVNGGLDDRMPHYSTRSIFMLLIIAPRLHSLLSGWCINDYNLSMHYSNDIFNQSQIEDDSDEVTNFVLFGCSEVKLVLKWNRNQIEVTGFTSTNIESNGLLKDLMETYSLYYSFDQALLEIRVHFYENVSYTISKSDEDYQNVKLKVGEIVEATLFGESEQTFECSNKWDSLLDCPIYHIQHSCNNPLNQFLSSTINELDDR